jgi:hypothetical protein
VRSFTRKCELERLIDSMPDSLADLSEALIEEQAPEPHKGHA